MALASPPRWPAWPAARRPPTIGSQRVARRRRRPMSGLEAAARRDDPAKPARGVDSKGVAEIAKASSSLIGDRIGEAGAPAPPLAQNPGSPGAAILTQILARPGPPL